MEDWKTVLFINACVRKESRTGKLADQLEGGILWKIGKRCCSSMRVCEKSREPVNWQISYQLLLKLGNSYEEVCPHQISFPVADEKYLNKRDELISKQEFDDPMFDLARQFAGAGTIVIAAPYWDLSFPAALKQYFEQINVVGISFRYTEEGVPVGLCRADRLYYVTTAGGCWVPEEFGYGYVKSLAQNYYGIEDIRLIKAVGLDIEGADVDAILKAAEETIDEQV